MRFPRTAATTLLAVLIVTACASDPAPPPTGIPDAASAGPHGSHPTTSAAPAAPLRAGERTVDLALPEPYTPSPPNGGTDDYRCFLVDPGLTEAAYLTGSRFLPQNANLLHHAIFYRLSAEQADDAKQVDASSPGQGWTCFGDSGVPGQTAWVASWAPGTGETLMPDGFGFRMPPGSKLVMQIHYNLLGVADGRPAADQSGIEMRLADGGAPLTGLETTLAMAPVELPCEPGATDPLCDREAAIADVGRRFGGQSAGMARWLSQRCDGGTPAPGSTQHCDQPITRPGTIHLAGGHMHMLGRSIKVEINPDTPQARTVLDVPRYNFDNQALVTLPKPVTVHREDTVRVTCTHDATLRQQLPQLRTLPSRYVVWGEGTSDEMCLGIMIFAPEA
ncbi:hypothetical protein GCM10022251_23020 [Phytohabitans flavus]|uniref:Copper type II ascorbate-dependent monooxygenase C-terminal domain-containing protein n=1 Tax=Phytohabitans flavus TaxID=1076124 RepID=A0A6F8XRN9_9ACTN|nr:monooxygenase [Phytohabitans flavus]BCB76512.1 hypothetical protein Pflav_029220 [Phytohabitans flavus]